MCSRHAGSVAFALMCGCLCDDVMCSRHAGSVAAHCSKAAMFASARPPCRQSARAVSRHQSSHKHRSCMRTNSISTGRLCGDVFASESAAKSIPARTAMPMTFCNVSNAGSHCCQRKHEVTTKCLRFSTVQLCGPSHRHSQSMHRYWPPHGDKAEKYPKGCARQPCPQRGRIGACQ